MIYKNVRNPLFTLLRYTSIFRQSLYTCDMLQIERMFECAWANEMGQALMEDARSRNICRVRRMNSLKELTKAGPPWLIGHRCKGEGGGPESPSSSKCPPPRKTTQKKPTHTIINYIICRYLLWPCIIYL